MPLLDNLHSYIASTLRFGRGWIASVDGAASRPAETLELFEFEACPYCRKVREVMSELDLDYLSRTCARGANTRQDVIERGGRAQFPYLIDPNADVEMYESEDIITHLLQQYGAGRRVTGRLLAPLNTVTATLASAVRPRGRRVRKGLEDRSSPEQPLILYSYEASPYCRKVRERLNELNLDAHIRNVAKKSPSREAFLAQSGKMQVPYLIDPNTGTEMFESDDIVAYLEATYA